MTLISAFRKVLHRILVSPFMRQPRGTPRASALRLQPFAPTLADHSKSCSNERLVSAHKPPKLPTDLRAGEGVADPRYLLAEITELRDIADRAGLGTLACALECARLECVWLVEQKAERRS